jgi:RNA polymerase sigma-70 factor (ECF subfamily)
MGEARAAAEVASRHHATLYRFSLSLARFDREEAEEIVQQTYLEVIEGRAKLLDARDPKAFLLGVARRVAASRRRRRSIWGRILRLEVGRSTTEPPAVDPESAAADGERNARVRAALGRLDGRQLELATLVFVEGMTVEEAGRALGVSVGSARTHYHRAKQKLARLLEEGDVQPR